MSKRICLWPYCQNEVVGMITKKYCSRSCALKGAVTTRRQKLKKLAVDHMGGKCIYCGYDKCLRALEFHHNQSVKNFAIGSGSTRSWKKVKEELKYCELICSNCHAELHEREFNSKQK